jgi:pyridoxamine 5'-phosphate oxidase
MNFAEIRNEYQRGELRCGDLNPDPIAQFEHWMQEAVQAGAPEPTAMSLATLDAEGFPRVRMVLLKGLDARGFVFFTNLGSRKGAELAAHAQACLLFPWVVMERQVIVRGRVERVSCEEAVEYFASRPRGSQLAAWASPQSQVSPSREALETSYREIEKRFAGQDVPLPPFWGGFRVQPDRIEFWQGRRSRLHDRFEYTLGSGGGWTLERLAP